MPNSSGRPVPAVTEPRSRLGRWLGDFGRRWLTRTARGARDASQPDERLSSLQGLSLSLRALPLVAFVASTAAVAWAFRAYYGGPMLPRPVFALGGVAWLVAGMVVRAWRKPVREGNAPPRGPRLDYVLEWIGLLWAWLALL